MANTNLVYRSAITTSNIKRSISSLGTGLKSAQKSATSLQGSIIKRNDQKRQSISNTASLFQRRREAVRKREQEDIVEAGSVFGGVRKAQKVVMNSTKGFMGRILDYIGTLMVGWAVVNLPTIIKMGQELGSRIQQVTKIMSSFMTDTTDFLFGFGQLLSGSFRNLISFDFTDSQNRVSSALERMRSSFNKMEDAIYDSIILLTKPFDLGEKEQEQQPGTQQPGTQQPGTQPQGGGGGGRYKVILDLVAKAEGGYDSVNYGRGPGKIPGLSKMTIREAYNASERYRARYGGTGAMGAYQLVDDPLGRATKAGLNVDKDLFSPENQDKIAVYLIEKERGITPDLIKNNPNKAALKLAQLFAGIPVLEPAYSSYAGRTVRRGESFYQGYGGNSATVSAEKVEKAFKEFGSTPAQTTPASTTPIPTGKSYKTNDDLTNTIGKGVDYIKIGDVMGAPRGNGRKHKGIDIQCPANTCIALRVDSEVVFAGWENPSNHNDGYGLVIDLWVPELGVQLRFGHCAGFFITAGKVKAGQSFARVGSTGNSTGPHIHFEYTRTRNQSSYGSDGDPSPYIPYILLTNSPNRGPVAAPDRKVLAASNITIQQGKNVDGLKNERRDNIIAVPLPSQQTRNRTSMLPMGGSGISIPADDGLNRFVTQKLLLDLAYT